MNDELNDIKNYSADDIRRYWNNQMSPAEMHALEKAAMEDPFLADALEGYSKLKSEPTEDIPLLQKRLAARSKGAPVVTMKRNYWWSVAALVLIIGGLGGLTFILNQDRNAAISKNEQSSTAVMVDTATEAKKEFNRQDTPQDGLVLLEKSSEESPFSANQKPVSPKKEIAAVVSSPDTSFASADYKSNDDVSGRSNPAPTVSGAVSGVAIERSRSDSVSGRELRKQEQLADKDVNPQGNYLNYFSGKVVDVQNRSIPFATVRMTNANQVAAADQYGYFQFKSRDSVAEISISSAGYQDRNIVMNSNREALSITLNPLNEKGKLKEVSPKSAGRKAYPTSEDAGLIGYGMDAEPVIGWDKYNLYLDSNKRIPTNEPRIHGDVIVSFKVNQKGELSSFDIEKSMSRAYNNEAIRLIKQGPAWRVIKGKKPEVKVIVKF